jgi:membrane fusion protein, multidrug efflux system
MIAMSRKRWIGLALVAALLVVVAGLWRAGAKSKSGQPSRPDPRGMASYPAVPVIAATVVQKDLPVYLEGLGTVVAFNTVTVKSRVDGQLVSVAFREGQEVRQGDPLAQVDPRPFEILVKQAEATLAKDQAQAKQAKLLLTRNEELMKENLIAQEQLDEQRATVAQLEAAIQADRAQVDNAKLQLSYSRITSPLNGRTGLRQVDPGNIIHANDQNGLVVITQLDPIAVLVTLPQDELAAINEQMSQHPLTAQAFSRDGQNELGTGEVSLVDNQINPTAGTLRLKAVFPNPNRALWPNQFVKVRVLLSTRKGALVAPASAIQNGPNGTFVYVVKPDQTVEARPVTATTTGDTAVVDAGLTVGEVVVSEGQFKLRPGIRVDAKGASSSPENRQAPKSNGGGASTGEMRSSQ